MSELPRPLRVYELSPQEIQEWAKWEDRVRCNDCRHRSDIWCRAGQGRTIRPPMLKHRCDDFKRARAR